MHFGDHGNILKEFSNAAVTLGKRDSGRIQTTAIECIELVDFETFESF